MTLKFNPLTPPFDYYEASAGGSPGGADTQIQYNDGGAFGGCSAFTYNDTYGIPATGGGRTQLTSIGVCTVSVASPAVVSRVSHGLSIGDRIIFSSTGAMPAPLRPNDQYDVLQRSYYIIADGFGADSFQISDTPGGAAINTTGAGSGTHTLYYSEHIAFHFDSDNDFVLDVQECPRYGVSSVGVRKSTDDYAYYPNYNPRFLVNCTNRGSYESPVAFACWINTGVDQDEIYGFWGGCYDHGDAAYDVTYLAVGFLSYNNFQATNARTVENIYGGQFTSEVNSNVTSDTIVGGVFQAIAAGQPTVSTTIGAWIKDCASTVGSTNYGLKIENITKGSTDYSIYTGTGQVRIGGQFGCNGATPQAKQTVNAACSDLSTAVALLNQIRTALINNGICV